MTSLEKLQVDGIVPKITETSVIPVFGTKKRSKYTKHANLTPEERKELRRKQNREAARRSRAKKAQQKKYLNESLKNLENQLNDKNSNLSEAKEKTIKQKISDIKTACSKIGTQSKRSNKRNLLPNQNIPQDMSPPPAKRLKTSSLPQSTCTPNFLEQQTVRRSGIQRVGFSVPSIVINQPSHLPLQQSQFVISKNSHVVPSQQVQKSLNGFVKHEEKVEINSEIKQENKQKNEPEMKVAQFTTLISPSTVLNSSNGQVFTNNQGLQSVSILPMFSNIGMSGGTMIDTSRLSSRQWMISPMMPMSSIICTPIQFQFASPHVTTLN